MGTTPASFFIDTATAELYTLSLHDALPILPTNIERAYLDVTAEPQSGDEFWYSCGPDCGSDRKSTRLNSSHPSISYAVFCLKNKTTRAPAGCRRRAATSCRCLVFSSRRPPS